MVIFSTGIDDKIKSPPTTTLKNVMFLPSCDAIKYYNDNVEIVDLVLFLHSTC